MPGVAADPVDPVHGEVAGLELVRDRSVRRLREPRRRRACGAGEPNRSSSVATASLPARTRSRSSSGASTGSRVGHVADDLAHAVERAVTAGGDDEPVVRGGQDAQPLRELRGVTLRRAPVGEPEVDALGELRQVQLHPAGRARPRASGAPARPGHPMASASASASVVRLARPVERAARLGHARPTRPRAAARPGSAASSNRSGASVSAPSHKQAVGEPLQAGRGTGLRAARRRSAARARSAVVGDQLADGRHVDVRRPAPSTAAWTGRTRAATRSRRPSTPGAPAAPRGRGTRRRHRRAPRTRRGARRRRRGRSRGRRAAPRGRRAGARGRRPAPARGSVPSVGIMPCMAGERRRDERRRGRLA